jgi:hypothetical protein
LGLFGSMHGCALEALAANTAKDMLRDVMRALLRARLVQGQVCRAISGASR